MAFDEVLAICLDALDGGQEVAELLSRYPQQAAQLTPLLESAVWFSAQAAAVDPRPGFVAASRGRLEKQIASQPAPASIGRSLFGGLSSTWRAALQIAAVLAVLVCLVFASTGIAYASQSALPGDPLYSVKLGLEQVELFVNPDLQGRIHLHMEFSQLRITEMQRLLALNRYNDLEIATARYRYHIDESLRLLRMLAAQDPALAQVLALELEAELLAQADTLRLLADISPEQARGPLEEAEAAARDGAQQAHEIGQNAGTPSDTPAGAAMDATPTPTITPTPSVVSSATLTSSPTSTQTPTQTRTPTPTATWTRTSASRPSATYDSTKSPSRTPTATAKPNKTATPKPGTTITPTATRTSQPTPTRTGQPTPTRTTQPPPTATGQPTPTRTSPPPPTATGIPPTSTTAPPPTRTPRPTSPPPTDTPRPSPYPYPDPSIYPPP